MFDPPPPYNFDNCSPSAPEDLSHEENVQLQGLRYAQLATSYDEQNDLEPALQCYQKAINYLLSAKEREISRSSQLDKKISEYISRAQVISDALILDQKQSTDKQTPLPMSDLNRAHFLLNQALELDAQNKDKEAVQKYLDAVELCLKAKNIVDDNDTKAKLSRLANEALSRAEKLSGKEQSNNNDHLAHKVGKLNLNQSNEQSASSNEATEKYASNRLSLSEKKLSVVGPSSYTKDELSVIKKTSVINGIEYPPFLLIDLKENFQFPLPFTDKMGLLPLAHKQKRDFYKWARFEEISSNPTIIRNVDCFSIKQTLVSDCSFIASLTVAALYEKKFKKKLITHIIYPQNSNYQPVYNPSGKYMIKLHINGLDRKVIVDDLLPIDRYGDLLCSHSVEKDEFWVSLLEKAYMKVMGGYDFPGSNSCIDLNALTGWIPERLTTKDSLERTFSSLMERYHRGDVLITLATGNMPPYEEERTGLVPNHAYAVLDMREVEGQRLMLLKNPWRHLEWKGKFSDYDDVNWTHSLQTKLNYDPKTARQHDNGIFWIDLNSICNFFETVFLNWKCSLFQYTFSTHSYWHAGRGPAKDLYNIGENPQFHLSVSKDPSSVWVLLTRHIVDKNDFAQNQEFITIVVYKGKEKVYIPFDPPPYVDGVRINSPHYLCKISIPKGGCTNYILVISQYEKTTTIYYTLRVYSTVKFNLKKLDEEFQYLEKVTNGEWDDRSAGGCANYPTTYPLNPVFVLEVNGLNENTNTLLIDLKGPKEYSIGFEVTAQAINDPSSSNAFRRVDSGPFRSGFTILKLSQVPQGTYHIIPSTFNPGQKGPFFLTVKSTCPIKLSRLK